MLINIISYIFLSIIFGYFMWDFKVFQTFQIFVFSIFSFAISLFISDKFKLSNIKFIKILQKFVFINIILALIGLILYLFQDLIFETIYCDGDSDSETESEFEKNKGKTISTVKKEEESFNNTDVASVTSNIDLKNEEYYSFKVKKDVFDNVLEKGKELLMEGVKEIGPNLGVGAAAGKVAVEAFKHTSGMASAPRLATVGATAFATALGTKVGIELGKVLMENKGIKNKIDTSKLDEIDKDGSNSPSDFGGSFISSVLEESEIPLITMVNGLCYLNYIEFSLFLGLFSLFLRKILYRKLKRFILIFKNKYIKNTKVESINDENVSLNKAFNIVDKYTDYIIVYILICLF
jgi:hypothetical protein